MKRIIDYDWSISYSLRLTTPIVDGTKSIAWHDNLNAQSFNMTVALWANQKFVPNCKNQ